MTSYYLFLVIDVKGLEFTQGLLTRHGQEDQER
jgi:hypothetical protein